MKNLKTISAAFTALSMMLVMSTSQAATLSFENITHNSEVELADQLSVDYSSTSFGGSDGMAFTFYNEVGKDSSLTDIFFDLGTGASLFSSFVVSNDSDGIADETGVHFATVQNLNTINTPGLKSPEYGFTADYGADAPTTSQGLDSAITNEWVTIFAAYGSSLDASDFDILLASGEFRIGVHMRSIGLACTTSAQPADCSDSDTYLTVSAVPVPAAAWLFGTALFGFAAATRRKKNS